MEICREIAGDAVWALGMGFSESGDRQWEVYCGDIELSKQLPKEYAGNHIHVVIAPRPTQEQIVQAKTKRRKKNE